VWREGYAPPLAYPWQEEAVEALRGRSGVLAAPTGSGKTWVAYRWAHLLDASGMPGHPRERVIFTAPIKALSNERYLDLRKMGLDVGIETGDFKKNADAPVLCCTQEIYTLKYAGRRNIRLVVDEFHYIFTDPPRARTYMDGLRLTDPEVPLLMMSATFGEASRVKLYLERVLQRPFVLFESEARITELVFSKEPVSHPADIRNALVFLFSRQGVEEMAEQTALYRERLPREKIDRIRSIGSILGVKKVPHPLLSGVGLYHGSLLPREKLLVETAFRERLLDVVVGTDALALGVNLPAEYVIFAQLASYHDDAPISKNHFLQMAGRAGRKGLYEKGYVTWFDRSPWENRFYDTGEIYAGLLKKPSEPAAIELSPSYGRLLREECTLEAEARMVAQYSLPERDYWEVVREIRSVLRKVGSLSKRLVKPHLRKKYRDILGEVWFDEMELEQNMKIARLFCLQGMPHALSAVRLLEPHERNRLQALLRIKRLANALPRGYGFKGMSVLEKEIHSVDATVFTFEERLREIEESRSF
jgi:superfamily II RNA helicase